MTCMFWNCMTLLRAAVLGIAALVAGGVNGAVAEQIDLIVDRGPRAVEIFLGMPASTAVTRFGLDADLLTGPDGAVNFADFSGGTWDIGDALLADVDIRIGTAVAEFEATSLMVHLNDQRLPFLTPLDGLTAISVCGVAQPPTPPVLDDLYLYAGFVTYPSDTYAALRFDLPISVGDDLSVVVHEYGPDQAGTPIRLPLQSGEPLIVGGRSGWSAWPYIVALAVLSGIVALGVARRS